jgi:hypothetical protein
MIDLDAALITFPMVQILHTGLCYIILTFLLPMLTRRVAKWMGASIGKEGNNRSRVTVRNEWSNSLLSVTLNEPEVSRMMN